jgi:hypothetical protein
MRMQLADLMAAWVSLEEQVAVAVLSDPLPPNEIRVYEWRPTMLPELPAIWNWIETGEYETVDTARADDEIVLRSTIGVKPGDIPESMSALARIYDHYRAVIDPALRRDPSLGGKAHMAKRTNTHSEIEDFDGVPVLCLAVLARFQLRATVTT